MTSIQNTIAETNPELYERAIEIDSLGNNSLWLPLYQELIALSQSKEDIDLMNSIGEDNIDALKNLSPSLSYLQIFTSSYSTILSLNGGDTLQIIYWFTKRPNELNDKRILFSSIWSYETAQMVYKIYRKDNDYRFFAQEGCSLASLLSSLFIYPDSVADRLINCIEKGHGNQVERLVRKIPRALDYYIGSEERLASLYLVSLEYDLEAVQDIIFPFIDTDFIIRRLIEENNLSEISHLFSEDPLLPKTWMEYFRLAVDTQNTDLLSILADHIPTQRGEILHLIENDPVYEPVARDLLPFLYES